MLTETDLPCPDCGGDLAEHVVDVRSLPGPQVDGDPAAVGFCPNCQVRFYPERTLTRLYPSDRESSPGGA